MGRVQPVRSSSSFWHLAKAARQQLQSWPKWRQEAASSVFLVPASSKGAKNERHVEHLVDAKPDSASRTARS